MRYEEYLKNFSYGIRSDPTEIVQRDINRLIWCLYKPDKEQCFVPDEGKIGPVRNDPINWARLSCYEVKGKELPLIAYIGPAAPDSPNLKQYIEDWLKEWGWDVVVFTEW